MFKRIIMAAIVAAFSVSAMPATSEAGLKAAKAHKAHHAPAARPACPLLQKLAERRAARAHARAHAHAARPARVAHARPARVAKAPAPKKVAAKHKPMK